MVQIVVNKTKLYIIFVYKLQMNQINGYLNEPDPLSIYPIGWWILMNEILDDQILID